jgi:hypothetical protein
MGGLHPAEHCGSQELAAHSQALAETAAAPRSIDEDHDVWFDQHLTGGQQWWNNILSEIRKCEIFVAVLPELEYQLDLIEKLKRRIAVDLRPQLTQIGNRNWRLIWLGLVKSLKKRDDLFAKVSQDIDDLLRIGRPLRDASERCRNRRNHEP